MTMTTQTTGAALPANPFPGMNPYLERSDWWSGVSVSIIVALADVLTPRLMPDYAVRIEQRVYAAEEPDVGNYAGSAAGTVGPASASVAAVAVALPAVELERQRYLQVLRVDTMEVVAVIELLSPSNKRGEGRWEYLGKRAAVLSSLAHLVEIDLLRAGPRMPVIGAMPDTHYRILVASAHRTEPVADLYAFGINAVIPEFVLPLAPGSDGISVDLNAAVRHVYAHGSYSMLIDYAQNPEPPLSDDDRVWLDGLLREQGLRADPNVANQEE